MIDEWHDSADDPRVVLFMTSTNTEVQESLPSTESTVTLTAESIIPEQVVLQAVRSDAHIFELHEPLTILVKYEDALWVFEYPALGILAFADTYREALKEFSADFAACWQMLAEDSPKNLTVDARILRQHLLSVVRQVESVA